MIHSLVVSLTKQPSRWCRAMRGSCCLVPRPQYFARPKRFGSRGSSEDLFPTRSPRIRHLSELTERDWEHAVQRQGKRSCIRRPRFPALISLFCLCEWQEWSWFFDPRLIRLLRFWKRIKMLHKISFGPKGYYSGPRGSSHHNDTVILRVSKLSSLICISFVP